LASKSSVQNYNKIEIEFKTEEEQGYWLRLKNYNSQIQKLSHTINNRITTLLYKKEI